MAGKKALTPAEKDLARFKELVEKMLAQARDVTLGYRSALNLYRTTENEELRENILEEWGNAGAARALQRIESSLHSEYLAFRDKPSNRTAVTAAEPVYRAAMNRIGNRKSAALYLTNGANLFSLG